MKPPSPLQTLIDPFVESFGGELVARLVQRQQPQPKQADYFFRRHGVIAELKALEKDSFGDAYSRKLGELCRGWQNRGLAVFYGTPHIRIRELNPICQREWMNVLADPLQKVVANANRQIRQTAELLNVADAKGVLWVASDGNLDLQPGDVWSLLGTILGKKKEDGSRQYSNINGVIYFTPRVPVRLPDRPDEAGLVWFSAARDEDPLIDSFHGELSDAWTKYLSRMAAAAGQTFTDIDVPARSLGALEDLRFHASKPKVVRASTDPNDVPKK